MPTALIGIVGMFFLGMGCVALAALGFVPRQFGMSIGGEPGDSDARAPHVGECTSRGGDAGRAEVRAVYGGFGLSMAAILGLALYDDSLRGGIVVMVGAALAGMTGGRVLSALLGDRTRFYPNWFYFGVEAFAAAALLLAA
ncbi:DUF4345 family protein [Prauserella alba]|uniref:DUF4345 domain-containing protein n=1 Tax=Prauserella alba TaxID=176898 RepID=A0ABN1VDZ5_9PSEU|nr:DUF4345 family protein [Prauserella alba]MCP2182486.1 protein of unknown function (DUF4345) [Prauserella alba]